MGVIPDKFGVMAVDPGGVSGICQGLFNVKRIRGNLTMRKLLARAVEKDSIRVDQIFGGPDYKTVGYDTGHVHRIVAAWTRFVFHCNVGMEIPTNCIFLVFEDFQLRQRSAELDPVQITAGFECVMVERPGINASGLSSANLPALIKQMPSEAMTYATNARLKEWGVYPLTRGKEHGRDAMRHVVLRASKILDGDR